MAKWGGRFNVMIPFFEGGGERWLEPFHEEDGLSVARGYIDFFEPDVLVESSPGMAERLGWHDDNLSFGLPRVVGLEKFYEQDYRGRTSFAAGIDILEAMQRLYDQEYKFERRHKRPFAKFDEVTGNAFFDVVGGRYPNDEALLYISQAYDQIFSPERLPLSEGSAMKLHREGFAGPGWLTRHELEVSVRNGISDRTFYVFDPTNAGDVIDYWNYRLIERNVIPINLEWFAQHSDFIREGILQLHRPIPGNPYGTKFHSTVHFGSSVSDETARTLLTEYLSGLPDMSWMWGRDPKI